MLQRLIDGSVTQSSGQQRLNNVDQTNLVLWLVTSLVLQKNLEAYPLIDQMGVFSRRSLASDPAKKKKINNLAEIFGIALFSKFPNKRLREYFFQFGTQVFLWFG